MSNQTALLTSIRVLDKAGSTLVYDLDLHAARLYSSIQSLGYKLPQGIQQDSFLLFLHNQVKNFLQYHFNQVTLFTETQIKLNQPLSLRSQSKIYKLRVIYKPCSNLELECKPYTKELNKSWSTQILKPEEFQVDVTDQSFKHKLLPRPKFEKLFAEYKCDEVIWQNNLGQICEGSFSNVFWQDHHGDWFTVPLSANILPGVMRQKIIDNNPSLIQEKHITAEELLQQKQIYLSNSIINLISLSRASAFSSSEFSSSESTKFSSSWSATEGSRLYKS